MVVDPRQQHLDADHVRHPVLDGQRVRVEPDQGFALTLAIGVVVSLFSAITVTRSFCGWRLRSPAGAAAVVVDGRQAGRGHA